MSNKILCTCGVELTINKNIGPKDDIPVVDQCKPCILAAYTLGWVEGDAATEQKTTAAAILTEMAIEDI